MSNHRKINFALKLNLPLWITQYNKLASLLLSACLIGLYKGASLIFYRMNYDRKKFYESGPKKVF
jgi:hypothetical protein